MDGETIAGVVIAIVAAVAIAFVSIQLCIGCIYIGYRKRRARVRHPPHTLRLALWCKISIVG